MRKLKRKVKNSVEYKNESGWHYLAWDDCFSMRKYEKPKKKKKKERALFWESLNFTSRQRNN